MPASRLISPVRLLLALLTVAVVAPRASSTPPDAALADDPFGRKYPARVYQTVRLAGAPPRIDGQLDDPAWQEGEWSGDYKQHIPTEGAPPSKPTQIKILYDSRNVYVAVRAFDDPARIHRYPSRRDTQAGDIVGVCFDSYFDKRGGFEFDLTAGGSKIDLILGNEGWDMSWDAVWHGKVGFEEDAWVAEFRIPLSQLRYGSAEEQVWGLHAWRWIGRLQEEDQWNLIPRNNTGYMHNIGELHGIRDLERYRHVELLPHVVGEATRTPEVAGDPYSGDSADGSLGLDAKLGLSTDFTLDATINPDFGQVEADPSVVNLTAYETFFEEKRPFFLEGKNILTFDPGGGSMLFYTRRIGQAPSGDPELADGEHASVPDSTSILSAIKVTGKTRDGLSLGVVQSLTTEESARVFRDGSEDREVVEPWSNYFVARVRKDWDKGNTSLGGIFTSTHRFIDDESLELLPVDALTAGVDFTRYFDNRTWALEMMAVGSHVRGTEWAIGDLQRNAVHYFQRPDASHLSLDESDTSLTGHGGLLQVSRTGRSKWKLSGDVHWSSPGLELNDLGYLRQADQIDSGVSVGYAETEPRGPVRQWELFLERDDQWDFGGLHTEGTLGLFGSIQFQNRWGLGGSLLAMQDPVDTRLLRGGPAMRLSRYLHMSLSGHTDFSRRLGFSMGVHGHTFADGDSRMLDFFPGVRLRILDSLSLSANLAYGRYTDDLQYVATPEPEAGARYILGQIDQKTLSATFRINFYLTPDLSIQYYGSPFLSSGRYSDFKRATASQAEGYEDRFDRLGPDELTYRPEENSYSVVEADGATYSFDNPEFSFREFRSNLVLRWEYVPGSSLYVVWSQGRTSESEVYEESFQSNLDALKRAAGDHVFLVKLSYWFSM
jgi:hypothetical protein